MGKFSLQSRGKLFTIRHKPWKSFSLHIDNMTRKNECGFFWLLWWGFCPALVERCSRIMRKNPTHPTYSGQITIFHQPRFPWNKGISLTKPPFGVRSCEVAIITQVLRLPWKVKPITCHKKSDVFCPNYSTKTSARSNFEKAKSSKKQQNRKKQKAQQKLGKNLLHSIESWLVNDGIRK